MKTQRLPFVVAPLQTDALSGPMLPASRACTPDATRDSRWEQFQARRDSLRPHAPGEQPSAHYASMQSAVALLSAPNEASVFGAEAERRADRPLPADVIARAEAAWSELRDAGKTRMVALLQTCSPEMLREMDASCWRDELTGLRQLIKKKLSGAHESAALLALDRAFGDGLDPLSGIAEKFLRLNQQGLDGEEVASDSELVTHYAPTQNNKLTLLVDGENAFPQMINAIEHAKETVNVAFFIVADDRLGNALADALIAASKRGCEVRLSMDAIGSHLTSKEQRALVQRLRDGGVEVHCNWMLTPMQKHERANHPDHRKLVLVDGKVGFTGGMNVAERYVDEYHDLFVRAEGDVVKQMQSEFLLSWIHNMGPIAGDRNELARKFFPRLDTTVGACQTKVAQHIPGEHKEILQTYLDRIAGAQKRILIENPYLTNPEVREAVIAAAKRGVEVHVVLPGRNDQWYSAMAMRTHYPALIDAGVQVYEYPGFNHGKTMVVDDRFVTIGTSNLDDVGLKHIYELNLNVEDATFAHACTSQIFGIDIPKARLMSKADVTSLQNVGGKVLSGIHYLM